MRSVQIRRHAALASFAVLALLLAALLAAAGCHRQQASSGLYHCPMHPTYTADRPGVCPICNMNLVPKESDLEPAAVGDHAGDHGEDHGKDDQGSRGRAPAAGAGERRVLFYRNPMDPTVTSPVPAQDSMGMDYVPVYADELPAASAVPGYSVVEVGPEAGELMGLETATVERRRLERTVRTVGTVMPDERRQYRVTTKIAGWVEKLYVNFSGQLVRRGQPILAIYSPELLASQEEYLIARQSAERFLGSQLEEVRRGGEDLVAAARRRLALFDVPESFIVELEKTGKARRTVDLQAPASGYVLSKEVLEGRAVEPGAELFTVNDLSHVWLEASFYESEAPWLAVGQRASLHLPYDRGKSVEARVSYIYPSLDLATRTLRVRFDLDNADGRLKPGMYLDVEHQLDLGESLVVPDSAVIATGLRQLVFVEAAPGRYEPREVTVGERTGGVAQIASGVAAGEKVVVGANFLLDSESRLKSALASAGAGEGNRP